jgi:hypothetical protein
MIVGCDNCGIEELILLAVIQLGSILLGLHLGFSVVPNLIARWRRRR